jgi:hypothetical protein
MRPPNEREEAGDAEIIAAESTLARRQFLEAQQHLAEAERLGASRHEVERLRSAAVAAVQRQVQRGRQAPWAGFGIGVAGYLLLSIQQPPGWTIPGWVILAFLVVPALIGGVTGRWQGLDQEARTRFWAGGRAGGGAMALYSGLSLIAVRQRFSTNADAGQVVLVGLFVTLVYAVLAGAVAGLASALTGGRGGPEQRA